MASPERFRVYAMLNFVGLPLTKLLGYAPGWAGFGDGPAQGRVRAMGRLGHERALSVHRSQTAGPVEFRELPGRATRAVPFRRSLGDAAGGRIAVLGIYRDRARDPDHHARRCRRGQDRPFRFLPPRAPRHAVARRGGMDPGGGVAGAVGSAASSGARSHPLNLFSPCADR